MRRIGFLAFVWILVAVPGLPRQEPVICGTHPEKWKEELFLHRQSERARATRRLQYSVAQPQPPSAARDIGNIAILEDSDGVIARLNEFDLDQKMIAFQPTTTNASRYRFQVSDRGYDGTAATAGTPIRLADDDSRSIPLPFPFSFFGVTYQQVYLNSDGNLTFTAGDTATNERSLGRLAAGPPRIAPLFDDLDPSQTPQGVRILSDANRFVVSWVQVPEYSDQGFGAAQSFQVRLYPDGHMEFAYSGTDVTSAVVGISPGNLQGSSTILSFIAGSSAEYSSTVAERFTRNLEVDIQTAAQKFYETHDDAYDYLVFFNDLDIPAGTSAVAYESTVRNDRSGYGDEQVDVGPQFGSPSRLQSVMNMGNLQQYPVDPNGIVNARYKSKDTPTTIIAHEAGHLFLAYASIRDPNNPNARPMLGFQNAHWNFAFNSEASLLEGNRIRDDGPNAEPRFTTTGTVEWYSPLDQYLMGFRAADEVEPFHRMFLVRGVPASYSLRPPQSGVSFDGQRQDIHIPEIIQAVGRRTPDYTVSQRHFRFAFILIVAQGTDPKPDELAQIDAYRTSFEAFYRTATSDRAWADTTLKHSLELSTFPASGVLAGQSLPATVSVQKAPAAPLTVTLQTTGSVDVPPSVTIPAGATSAGFTITGIRPGVDQISAVPSDGNYETDYSNIQVAAASTLQLAVVSGDAQAAAGGSPLPDPIVVRVSDANNLTYGGVRVQAVPSAGGSVMPSEAVTDSNGTVSFHWTPGAADLPQLRISVQGGAESGSIAVTANSGKVAAAAVVNAASFTPGIAPGSLASIYGINLAGGARTVAGYPWPDSLSGVSVTLNGTAVPLLFVSDGQINFFVPGDLPQGTANLTISNALGTSATFPVPVTAVAPGIFFDSATNFGAVLNANSADTTLVRPAASGGYIEIYCTGLGAVQSVGQPPLEQTLITPTVSIGGLSAQVVFSGLAPGFTGLYQVDVKVPDGLSPGIQPLSLSADGVSGNQVLIGVQ